MEYYSYVYIMSDRNNKVLYTGVTSNLLKRVWEHKCHVVHGFIRRYGVTKLVYYEEFADIYEAITREKQIKGKVRARKIKLIEEMNPSWEDLYKKLIDPE